MTRRLPFPSAQPQPAARVALDRIRRHVSQRADQAATVVAHRFRHGHETDPFDGSARFALLTVNFSTTRYLKLMLLTLCEQDSLGLVTDLVLCDNGSVDGGPAFLRALAETVPVVSVVLNRRPRSHAAGMRAAQQSLRARQHAAGGRSNVLLYCDTDVVFRNPATLDELRTVFEAGDIAFAGELRYGLFRYPEAQASFLAVRRDWAEHPTTMPWVDHGSPAYWMQRSIWRKGGVGADFASNHGGYILHRGRSGVAAAARHHRRHRYASVANRDPHFMGVRNGPHIWNAIEARYGDLLDGPDDAVVEHIRLAFEQAGTDGG